jgi:hypothetical protein
MRDPGDTCMSGVVPLMAGEVRVERTCINWRFEGDAHHLNTRPQTQHKT